MNGQKYLPAPIIIILITAFSIICPISTDMYLPALSEIVEFFGTTETILNVTLYGFFFMQAFGILFLGPLSDKVGRKIPLIITTAVFTLSSILCSFAPGIEFFIVMRCIMGFSAGGVVVISTALIKDCFREEKIRDRVLTLTVFFSVIGPVIAPILGARIIENFGWRYTLFFPGIVTALCLLVTFFLTEPLKKSDRITCGVSHVLLKLPKLLKNKAFTLFLFSMSGLSISFMSYLAVSSYLFEGDFGLSPTQYSLFLAGNAIAASLLMLLLQKISAKTGARNEGRILIILAFVSVILLFSVASANPWICIFSILPVTLAAFTARPYTIGILMRQYQGDTGSVSALFYFVHMMYCCLGLFLGGLPWATHIFGLSMTVLIGALAALIPWFFLALGGFRLIGMEKKQE